MLVPGMHFVRSSLAMAVCCAVACAAQTRPTAGPYTAAQATAGRAAYLANCASCHLPDLAGRNEAPPLTGSNFMRAWGPRTTSDLLALIQSTMPPENRGNLGQETYINLVAFLLEANGSPAGNQPLTQQTGAPIRVVATGQMPASLRQALAKTSADQPSQRPT